MADALATCSGSTSRGPRRGSRAAICPSSSENITWNSGAWVSERSIPSASTRRSNGRSWCWYAPSVSARTPRSTSRKVAPSGSRVRTARVLTKKPMIPSSSTRVRPAMGVPTTTSSCPAWRARRSCHAASSVMNGVASSSPDSLRSAAATPPGTRISTAPERVPRNAVRGRSVGSSRSGGAPASRPVHQASSPARTSPESQPCCHTA